LNRQDLSSVIPDFITLAETRLNRHPAVQDEVRTTLTLNAATVSLPDDCREVTSLYYDDGTRFGPLDIVGPERLADYSHKYTTYPRAAAISEDGTALILAPAPDQAYVVKMVYQAKLTALSDTSTTNWLLTSHPDIYLFATLMESAPYLRDDERVPVWQSRLEQALAELEGLSERRRFSANTPIIKPRRAIT